MLSHISSFYGSFAGTRAEDATSDPDKVRESRLATEAIFVQLENIRDITDASFRGWVENLPNFKWDAIDKTTKRKIRRENYVYVAYFRYMKQIEIENFNKINLGNINKSAGDLNQ